MGKPNAIRLKGLIDRVYEGLDGEYHKYEIEDVLREVFDYAIPGLIEEGHTVELGNMLKLQMVVQPSMKYANAHTQEIGYTEPCATVKATVYKAWKNRIKQSVPVVDNQLAIK